MVKVRIRAGRGTGGFIWVDSDASKWTGDEYKKIRVFHKFHCNCYNHKRNALDKYEIILRYLWQK